MARIVDTGRKMSRIAAGADPRGRKPLPIQRPKTAMTVKLKKSLTASLSLFMTLWLAAALMAVPAAALPDGYTASEGYLSSPYYAALEAYKPSGDERRDTVALALTQLGYHEGDSDLDFDGLNTSGSKNFVEYNRLYGKLDNGEGNGTSYGYAWCAAFVSFCLRSAHVPTTAAISEVSCPRMVNWYRSIKDRTAWQGSDYIPMTGDVIFFKTGTSNAVSTHVGLVVGTTDDAIYTVEGNSGGVVGMHRYERGDKTIVGYGIPAYSGTPEGAVYDFELRADNERTGVFFTTASDGLNFRAEPNASSAKLTDALPMGTRVEVTETKNGWGRIEYSGKSGWVSMSYLMHEDDVIYSVYYKSSKAQVPNPVRKKPGESVTIAEGVNGDEGYRFVGWEDRTTKTIYQPGDTYTADATITLNAKYELLQYTVRFMSGDTVVQEETYFWGDKLTPPADPEMPADDAYTYKFTGWDATVPGFVTEDLTINAVYERTAVETTAAGGNGGCGSLISLPAAGCAVVFALGACLLPRRRK